MKDLAITEMPKKRFRKIAVPATDCVMTGTKSAFFSASASGTWPGDESMKILQGQIFDCP